MNLLSRLVTFLTWFASSEELPQIPKDAPESSLPAPPSLRELFWRQDSLPQAPAGPRTPSALGFRDLFLAIDSLPQATNSPHDSSESFFSWFLRREKLPASPADAAATSSPTRR